MNVLEIERLKSIPKGIMNIILYVNEQGIMMCIRFENVILYQIIKRAICYFANHSMP